MIITLSLILIFIMFGLCEPLFFYYKNKKAKTAETVFKCLSTGCSVILCLCSSILTNQTWVYLILVGLILSVTADAVISYNFIYGIFVFLSAHIFYIAGFLVLSPFNVASLYIFAALSGIMTVVFYILRPLNTLLLPGIFYASIINIMVSLSIPLSFDGTLRGTFLAFGAILFLISDVWLAKHVRFGSKRIYEICSITIYYAGQYLFALAASAEMF